MGVIKSLYFEGVKANQTIFRTGGGCVCLPWQMLTLIVSICTVPVKANQFKSFQFNSFAITTPV